MPTEDDDRAVLELTTEAICEAVCHTLDRAWRLSPWATLTALGRVLLFLAVEHVAKEPDRRAATLALLRSVVEAVDAESGVKH